MMLHSNENILVNTHLKPIAPVNSCIMSSCGQMYLFTST